MNCACGKIVENPDTGLCGSCARAERKALEAASKPPKEKKPIKKVGTKNTFLCSDGTRVTQAEINRRRNLCYDMIDLLVDRCEGCGNKSQGHAHIIPQARSKQLNKTELIWDFENIFPSCHNCNSIAENVSSIGITKLKNYPRIKAFLELHDRERFEKICYTENEKHKI